MSDVLAFSGVSVVRGGNTLLADISWEVEEGQRWVILGPNGAGKTTLLQLAAARIHPSDGVVGILGEVLGAVDVFELRPRIGLASASIAERIPGGERVVDVVAELEDTITIRPRQPVGHVEDCAGISFTLFKHSSRGDDLARGTRVEGLLNRVVLQLVGVTRELIVWVRGRRLR